MALCHTWPRPELAEIARVLTDRGANLSAENAVGLPAVGRRELTPVMLQHGYSALMCACQRRSVDLMELLLELGADINHRSQAGLHITVEDYLH